jgi:hypothetical protein
LDDCCRLREPSPPPTRVRCASIFLDKHRRYIGKSQSERPPKRTQRTPHRRRPRLRPPAPRPPPLPPTPSDSRRGPPCTAPHSVASPAAARQMCMHASAEWAPIVGRFCPRALPTQQPPADTMAGRRGGEGGHTDQRMSVSRLTAKISKSSIPSAQTSVSREGHTQAPDSSSGAVQFTVSGMGGGSPSCSTAASARARGRVSIGGVSARVTEPPCCPLPPGHRIDYRAAAAAAHLSRAPSACASAPPGGPRC